jgi:hypothetical protein
MQLQALLLAAIAIAALVGCSKSDTTAATGPAASATAAPPCPPESPVKIDNVAVPDSGTTATIRVDPDPRQISQNAGGVRWTLKSPQGKTYEFTNDGVTFKANAPTGPVSSTPGKTEFVVCFGATPPNQTWPYTIKFVDKAAPATVWVCDPTIVNRETVDPKAAQATVNCTKQP